MAHHWEYLCQDNQYEACMSMHQIEITIFNHKKIDLKKKMKAYYLLISSVLHVNIFFYEDNIIFVDIVICYTMYLYKNNINHFTNLIWWTLIFYKILSNGLSIRIGTVSAMRFFLEPSGQPKNSVRNVTVSSRSRRLATRVASTDWKRFGCDLNVLGSTYVNMWGARRTCSPAGYDPVQFRIITPGRGTTDWFPTFDR